MEIAKLVLEYIKALAWPLTVLLLVLKFRGAIAGILLAVGNRLASAETVKFGVLGQEVELSGTARELKVEHQELLVASKTDREARERAGLVSLTEKRAIYLTIESDRRWTEMIGTCAMAGSWTLASFAKKLHITLECLP